jgi:hypothetical protein
MQPSLSCFILYLKISKNPFSTPYTQFVSLKRDITDYYYNNILNNSFKNIYVDCFSGRSGNQDKAVLSFLTPFNNKTFWRRRKDDLAKKILKEFALKTSLSGLEFEVKSISTPIALFQWTYSYKGASFGWAPTKTQLSPVFRIPLIASTLQFVGHWIGRGYGISTVAYLGKMLAEKNFIRNHE